MSTLSHHLEPNLKASVNDAIRRAQDHLLKQQSLEGYWWAELEANVTLTAEYIMLQRLLRTPQKSRIEQARRYLLKEQREHGGWELYWGDGGELSTSIEAYFALKLAGEALDSQAMQRAREFILSRGGVTRSRVFTKIHLALFDAYPWDGIPTLPAWFVLLPSWFPLNIYEMASWARSSTVPLLIVCDRRPLPGPEAKVDELFIDKDVSLKNLDGNFVSSLFLFVDRVLKTAERIGFVPFRKRAIKAAERWIIERREPSGDWAGIIPAMLNSLLALKTLGYDDDHPYVRRGLEAIERFGIVSSTAFRRNAPGGKIPPEGGTTSDEAACFRLQPCVSPTWDTALAITALVDSGLPSDHPALRRAGDWLLEKQIFRYGDWAIKNRKGKPAGWAFEFHNDCYPDVDDTAAVVMALLAVRLENESSKIEACRAAADWVASMECRSGGWAAFDVDNTQELFNRMPYGDLKAMIDPPTADLTGRVLEMFNLMSGVDSEQLKRRAIQFLHKKQEQDGSWWGRWGVNYIYGTYLAVTGLRSAGMDADADEVRRGRDWLLRVQNEDGGWGETCASYSDPGLKGAGISTASQTAWALLGLMASGFEESSAVSRGIRFLVSCQNQDGSWNEPQFTGTGFPGHFYINYHLYRDIFPLTALGRYVNQRPAGRLP